MKTTRLLLALGLVTTLAGVAYVAQENAPSGLKMTAAAENFLSTLMPQQKAKAVIDFNDKERTNWHFTPRQDKERKSTRKGLPLEEMTETQKKAALDLLKAGTSATGDATALAIMSLESILKELEKNGAMVRNPQWYFFAVFGTPGKTGEWGWRVEGHHLALNFTINNGKIVSSTPAFFGANPATIMSGPNKGRQNLPEAENLAKDLFKSLDVNQKKVAHHEQAFPEIGEAKAAPNVGAPQGLAANKMTDAQKQILRRLVASYAERLAPDIAAAQLAEVKNAGIGKVYFAYNGGVDQGQKHTYRIQGPTFVIEFLNVQADSGRNPANHIHSAWRSLKGDFGLAGE